MFNGLRALAWSSVIVGAFGVVTVAWFDSLPPPVVRMSNPAPFATARSAPAIPAYPGFVPGSRSGVRQAASNVFAQPAAIASTGWRRAAPPGFHFDPYVRYWVGDALPAEVAVGDVSGDGRADVVVVNGSGYFDVAAAHQVWVYRQGANGELLAPDKYDYLRPSEQRPGLALGDLNEDGVLDIVVGHGAGVTTMVHDGDGFVVTLKQTGRRGSYVGVLDVDRDGHLDVFGQSWADGATLFLGDGQGGLDAGTLVQTPAAGYNDLKVGDANADGTDDIVITNGQGQWRRAYILPVSPGGGFLPTTAVELGADGDASANVLIDVHGDARNDLAVAFDQLGVIRLHAQGADGAMASPSSMQFVATEEPGALAAADLDNNFTVDLVVLHNRIGLVGYYLRSGTTFSAEQTLAPSEAGLYEGDAIAIGDIDDNGCKDLVIADLSVITVYRGRGCLPPPVAQTGATKQAVRAR